MRRVPVAAVVLPLTLAVGACVNTVPSQPASTVLVSPPAQPSVAAVVPATTVAAPMPPPPPQSELVPPPPQGAGPVVWQPGHWSYTGLSTDPWSWVAGRYMPTPPGQTTWIPGQWQQTPNGSWMWITGHWA